MPIYEYRCDTCEHCFEMLQRVGADAPEACPSCGAAHVRKLVSSTSFVLKGSGWYKDGYGLQKGGSTPTPSETSAAKAAAK